MNDTGTPAKIGPFDCPKCQQQNAVLTSVHFGRRAFLCPDCEHVWLDPPEELAEEN
jgi:transposase-like protein